MVSCGDCHSNLTKWPAYSNVAPVSWLVQNDVNGGRSTLNVSEWNRPQDAASDVVEAILGGDMPPSYYTVIHRSASMSTPRSRPSRADGGPPSSARRPSPAAAGEAGRAAAMPQALRGTTRMPAGNGAAGFVTTVIPAPRPARRFKLRSPTCVAT